MLAPASVIDNFPNEIATIFVNKCATAGCHNAASYENAGGLLLDSWEHLFDGGNSGAVIVPYSTDYSSLLYFINTDSTAGITAIPTMPLNTTPLSKQEYLTIKNWIAKGAPDKNGNIPFASNAATRQKVYMVHQSCDVVGVIDAEKNVVMRYIPIGEKPYPESATYIRICEDGHAYVSFWYNAKVYKIDTKNDAIVETIDLGNSFWSTINIAADGKKLILTNGDSYDIKLFDELTQQQKIFAGSNFVNPHGSASNYSFDTFFTTSLFGNTLYKYAEGYNKKISIDGNPLTTASNNTPDPYDIIMSPDYSRYFVSCAKSNEIRVMDAFKDTLIKTIKTGIQPSGMAVSKLYPYLFVCCTEDNNSLGRYKGSVYVINYNTLEIVKHIQGKFYQPHGIAVNDASNTFYVFNRNQDYDGPAPHHQGPCSGRNGYYIVYDIPGLQPKTDKRYEVLVDPFVADIRFK